MKTKLLLTTTFLFFIFLSSKTVAQITLNFEIKNMANDSCMIGYYFGDKQFVFGDDGNNQMIIIDENGKGVFTRDDMKPGMLLLVFPPDNEYVELVFEGKDLNISLDRNYIDTTIHVNSLSNILMNDYNDLVFSLIQKHTDLTEKKELNPELSITADLEKITDEFELYKNKLLKNYPHNMFSKMVLSQLTIAIPESITDDKEVYIYYKEHYFDNINFNDDWLIRTPFFFGIVDNYMKNITFQNSESIIKSIDEVLGYMDEKSNMYKYFVIHFLNEYAKGTKPKSTTVYKHVVKTYYISGKATWASEVQLKKIIDSYHKMIE